MSRRRRKNSLNDTLSSSEDVAYSDSVTLSGLLNITWKAYHTSLFLEPNRSELNKDKILEITKTIAKGSKKNNQVNVILSSCPSIRLAENSPNTLLVQVSFNTKTVYIGYFLNWSQTNEPVDRFEKLPILLVKSRTEITRIVNNALIKAFDFVVTPILLNAPQLASLFTVFISYAEKEDTGSATLKYTVPELSNAGSITTTIKIRDLVVIFDFLNESIADDEEPVSRVYYEKILEHFRRAFKLDLGRAELRQITLPDAMVTDVGTFQMGNEDVLSATLTVLNTLFPKTVPQTPASSFPSDDSI